MGKRGRPKKEDLKRGQYRLRMSAEDEKMLAYICEKKGLTKAQIFREGLRMQYNLAKSLEILDSQDD